MSPSGSISSDAAFSAAGVFSAETALDLASVRAEAMDRCAAASPGGLLAVSGIDEGELLRLCEGSGLAVAIRLDRDSLVLGGPSASLSAIERNATAMGAILWRWTRPLWRDLEGLKAALGS